MTNEFDKILEKDEVIVKILKPNKKRFWRPFMWSLYIPVFWPLLIVFMVITLFTLPYLIKITYDKRFYAYTNKRLLVRCGTIGVDYETLRYKDVTSVDVYVGLFDKNLNTGKITFGSPSRPNTKSSQNGVEPFGFFDIDNPYETMKEINEYIEVSKI